MTSRSKSIRRLDELFSKYIRERDSVDGVFRCISCGRVLPYEQADCGHFIHRSLLATRWDETNCNAQCIDCNRFKNGNPDGYREGLKLKYGEHIIDELTQKSHTIAIITTADIKEKIKKYSR